MQTHTTHDVDGQARLIAKVLRDALAAESFATYADLYDALKARLARLRIRWTADDLNRAVTLIESNRPALTPSRPTRARRADPPARWPRQPHPAIARLVAASLHAWPKAGRT